MGTLTYAFIRTAYWGHYSSTVKYLEDYCQRCSDHDTKDYIEAQIMWLIKAYQENGQCSKAGSPYAIDLCRVVDREERSDVPDQTITKIVRRGFRLGGKILRPTEVITSSS